MDWFDDENDDEPYEFESERLLVPPTDGFLKRIFGSRWGLFLISAPESVDLPEILDFLADYSLRLAYYSDAPMPLDFEALKPEKRSITTIDDVLSRLDEITGLTDEENRENIPESPEPISRRVPRNPELVFTNKLTKENAGDVMETAITGKLVVAGIQSQGSFTAMRKIKRLLQSDHLVAVSLLGILSFNTVARICPECKVAIEYELEDTDFVFLGDKPMKMEGCEGMGCEACDGKGYSGRILIHESFEISPRIRTSILSSMALRDLRMAAKREGMNTLLDAAWALAEAGETSLSEVGRIAELTDPGKESGNGENPSVS